MITVFLSLGTNLGNRLDLIRKMVEKLQGILLPAFSVSNLMETEPVGVIEKQQNFLNVIVRGKYKGTVQTLLSHCQKIEQDLGRVRVKRFAPRTADIDILLFGHEIILTHDLIIPHPRILDRKFCLQGLIDLAPFWTLPGTNTTIMHHYKTMKKNVRDQKLFFITNTLSHEYNRER